MIRFLFSQLLHPFHPFLLFLLSGRSVSGPLHFVVSCRMKLTTEVIARADVRFSPLEDRELILRGTLAHTTSHIWNPPAAPPSCGRDGRRRVDEPPSFPAPSQA